MTMIKLELLEPLEKIAIAIGIPPSGYVHCIGTTERRLLVKQCSRAIVPVTGNTGLA